MKRPLFFFAGFALSFALVSGCKQGPGDRCEVDRDCSDGNICSGFSAENAGGICMPAATSSGDAGTPTDTGATHDANTSDDADATLSDAASDDIADSGSDHQGSSDTAATTDSGTEVSDALVETTAADGL